MNFKPYHETVEDLKKTIKKYNKVERIPITEALDRYLANDILAKNNCPEFPTSRMDGYACNSQDLINLKELTILGDLPAGNSPKNITIKSGECLKTFTGAIMCNGSDTLIPIENVEVKDNKIIIKEIVEKNFAVRKIGESYKKDELLLKRGMKLSFSEIALLAELGISYIEVFIKPKIAILSSGNEIVDVGERIENEAQIHASNHIALYNLVKLMGADGILCPLLRDEKENTKNTIINALNSCDILLTTGGVSVGDYDFVKEVVLDNFEVIVNGAAIKPGRHVKIAKSDEKYIFALPGFPYSSMVTCLIYLRVFLNTIFEYDENYTFDAIVKEDYKKGNPFLEFLASSLEYIDGKVFVSTKGKKQGSSAIISNLNKNAVLILCDENNKTGFKAGDVVKVMKLV